jgi:hypothetical protein
MGTRVVTLGALTTTRGGGPRPTPAPRPVAAPRPVTHRPGSPSHPGVPWNRVRFGGVRAGSLLSDVGRTNPGSMMPQVGSWTLDGNTMQGVGRRRARGIHGMGALYHSLGDTQAEVTRFDVLVQQCNAAFVSAGYSGGGSSWDTEETSSTDPTSGQWPSFYETWTQFASTYQANWTYYLIGLAPDDTNWQLLQNYEAQFAPLQQTISDASGAGLVPNQKPSWFQSLFPNGIPSANAVYLAAGVTAFIYLFGPFTRQALGFAGTEAFTKPVTTKRVYR